ncbi:glycosyltransferase family 29 protein [Ensifer sesbaniae]|uniref:glycosyltransferase family 29 protein n=1 Tax=Ensifer sesbaniae TaxID=1214071 RepID=UPI00156991C6|nr:glycosyltransferase family 29 protein [Ensifer sesbaniae]NRQ14614.1 hypothetical protein [Ensifer sesbaniae]
MLTDARSIAIVGNAASLLDANHGLEIDDHEVIIRMNRGLPTNPEKQGRRTSILAFSVFPQIADIYDQFGADKLIWMSPKLRDEAPGDLELEFYSLERWETLHSKLGARPSVGAMVLDYVSTFGSQSVNIYGFDFKRTTSTYLEAPHIGPHNYQAEEAFCLSIVNERNWRIRRDYAD